MVSPVCDGCSFMQNFRRRSSPREIRTDDVLALFDATDDEDARLGLIL